MSLSNSAFGTDISIVLLIDILLLFRSFKMPCCCAKNIDAAFVLGIVLAVLSSIVCFSGSTLIINGIIGVIINCILIFGAHTRNSTAILVWMILAILSCIGLAIMGVFVVIAIAHLYAGEEQVVVVTVSIVFMIGTILFQIWTIIVAKNARKEIEAGQ